MACTGTGNRYRHYGNKNKLCVNINFKTGDLIPSIVEKETKRYGKPFLMSLAK